MGRACIFLCWLFLYTLVTIHKKKHIPKIIGRLSFNNLRVLKNFHHDSLERKPNLDRLPFKLIAWLFVALGKSAFGSQKSLVLLLTPFLLLIPSLGFQCMVMIWLEKWQLLNLHTHHNQHFLFKKWRNEEDKKEDTIGSVVFGVVFVGRLLFIVMYVVFFAYHSVCLAWTHTRGYFTIIVGSRGGHIIIWPPSLWKQAILSYASSLSTFSRDKKHKIWKKSRYDFFHNG